MRYENGNTYVKSRCSAETRDLIVSQAYNGHVSVIEKATGAMMVHISFLRPLTREQIEFIASDCQLCYIVRTTA